MSQYFPKPFEPIGGGINVKVDFSNYATKTDLKNVITVITKTDFDDKLRSLNQKINSNKTKHLLVEKELKKAQTLDSIYFRGKSYFEGDGTQSYLVFQPMYRYFKIVSRVGSGNCIYFWKSKGLSDENITAPNISDCSLNPQLIYLGTKTKLEFKGCVKQDKITYDHGKVISIYIFYEINKNFNISSYPTLENVYLGQLHQLKMLILISINILNMVLDLIDMDFFHTLVVELV